MFTNDPLPVIMQTTETDATFPLFSQKHLKRSCIQSTLQRSSMRLRRKQKEFSFDFDTRIFHWVM